nr:ribonuclease H-like domain-containing protein [Tanacetum cinerariifolium]
MAENVIAAVSENCSPMLEKGMYDSWKTRILLYIRVKENGETLVDSIENGTYQLLPEITVKAAYGVTDIKLIPMSMSNIQINTKFVNHLQPEWIRVAKEVREMRQRFPKPLALLANTYNPPHSCSKFQYVRYAKIIKLQEHGSSMHLEIQGQINQGLSDVITTMVKVIWQSSVKQRKSLEETDDCEDLQLQATSNFKADHVDAYDSNCDDEAISNAIFMVNLSPVGSLNDDTVAPHNYVPPHVQKNDMMLSVIEQMKSQVEKCNKVNQEAKNVKESLTSELERYKDRVRVLEYAVKDGHYEKEAYLS